LIVIFFGGELDVAETVAWRSGAVFGAGHHQVGLSKPQYFVLRDLLAGTLSGTSMYPFKVHLNWFKDSAGYRLEDDLGSYGAHIVGNGGQLVPFSPFDGNDTVFADFASVTSSSSLLHFVEKYGLLGEPAYDVEIDRGRTKHITFGRDEDVDSYLQTALLFRKILEQSGKGWRRLPSSLAGLIGEALWEEPLGDVTLVGDRRQGFRMVLTANSLMSGLWLQLGQTVSDRAKFQTCALPSCGQIFEVGSTSGRRADARFCSDVHRIEFNSRNRTKRS
jgi:hypothetical protein